MRRSLSPLLRRASKTLICYLVACEGTLWAPSTFGQSPAAPSRTEAQRSGPRFEEAKRRFEAGLKLANEDWTAALAEFMRSLELFPTRAAARNAAVALRQLGRYAESYEMYEKLQQQFGTAVPAEETERIVAEQAELSRLVGELRLDVRQLEAEIVLDGVERGKAANTRALRLDPGRYTLEVNLRGFQRFSATVTIQAGQRTELQVDLVPSAFAGTLEVRETHGKAYDVLIDSLPIGKTPWRGFLPAGLHVVTLNDGKGMGTGPHAAIVKAQGLVRLTLTAVRLDAELAVRTSPVEARIAIDGVDVGIGLWRGRLPSGPHRIAVTLEGYKSVSLQLARFRGNMAPLDVRLTPAVVTVETRRGILREILSRSYAELYGGPLVGRSLRGSADAGCDCATRSRPLGATLGARVGAEIGGGLAAEVAAGWLYVKESSLRPMTSVSPDPYASLSTESLQDATQLSGPLLLGSVQLRRGAKLPFTARLGAGVARLRSTTNARGTFAGALVNPNDPSEQRQYVSRLNFLEDDQRVWAGLLATEVRVGYRISQHISADLGAALWLVLPERKERTQEGGQRIARLSEVPEPWADGHPVRSGHAALPSESVARTFLAITPSLGLRYEF